MTASRIGFWIGIAAFAATVFLPAPAAMPAQAWIVAGLVLFAGTFSGQLTREWLLGVSVAQISLLINTQIASRVSVGAVSWLTYADRLMEFPTALLGVALGVACAWSPPTTCTTPTPPASPCCWR